MIPEDHKTAIITNGIHFMRSITEAYGTDKGMELWEQITSILDPDVKGQIFFAMITGTYNDRVNIKGINHIAHSNAVACIKEIRQWSGLGLKESKDMYDRLRDRAGYASGSNEVLTVKPEEYAKAVTSLRTVGFIV